MRYVSTGARMQTLANVGAGGLRLRHLVSLIGVFTIASGKPPEIRRYFLRCRLPKHHSVCMFGDTRPLWRSLSPIPG